MGTPSFFIQGSGLTLEELASLCDGELVAAPGSEKHRVYSIAPLDSAGEGDVAFFERASYIEQVAATSAGCVIAPARMRSRVKTGRPVLFVADVQWAFALAGRTLHPDAVLPVSPAARAISSQAAVDSSALLEDDVTIEAFAVVGPGVRIGRGTIVFSGASVGAGCSVGRGCRIGQNVVLQHAIVGNDVVIHPNASIGQDGFGYAIGRQGIAKMVQIGRVVIQDGVEIGANTTIDRGAVRDTVIGENTKIDNQVQIAHNVEIGRNCVIVGQVAIAGSATIEDGVVIGGQSGVNGHVRIGAGSQIAAVSSVAGDVPPGSRWGGTPAHPVRDWMREMTWLREQARKGAGKKNGPGDAEA